MGLAGSVRSTEDDAEMVRHRAQAEGSLDVHMALSVSETTDNDVLTLSTGRPDNDDDDEGYNRIVDRSCQAQDDNEAPTNERYRLHTNCDDAEPDPKPMSVAESNDTMTCDPSLAN